MNRRTPLVVEGLEHRCLLSSVVSSVTTDQTVYKLGQPIVMTFTQVNASDQTVTIPAESPAGFSVTHNGLPVLIDFLPQIVGVGWTQTFQPGQTITVSQTWNGIPQGGQYSIANLTGTYVVDYGPGNDPGQYSTSFQIEAPANSGLKSTITTSQPSYEAGAPVDLSFTETNDGSQPVSVIAGGTDFEITQNGTTVWRSPGAVIPPPTWLTLEPGQSYSQTATWNDPPAAAGTFSVADQIDPLGSTATFQILGSTPPNPPPPTGITNPAPTNATLATNHRVYRIGEPISLSLVLKDVTKAALAHSVEKLTVLEGTTVIYCGIRPVRAIESPKRQPVHTVELKSAWPGHVNQAGIKKLTPGPYTIEVNVDGYTASTTVQLVSRRGPR